METHAEIGHEILAGSGQELLELAALVAWTHHERFDGSGYPRGLAGPEIQQRLISFGLATNGAGTPESTGELIRDMQAHWQALARELDIQPQ